MEVFEITGFQTSVSREGVNFLQPADSFQNVRNGFIYRQVLQSRKGFTNFSFGYDAGSGATGHLSNRVMGIFQNVLTATSTNETIVFDKDYAYKYNDTSNEFDRIPFNARLIALPGTYTFGISSNEDYISGTTYPTKTGANRFVFTGKGMNEVYFYNGTDIGVFTNVTDNTDYVTFAGKTLDKATHVFWFGERLNFISPVMSAALVPQGILYSGIRDSAGSGDSFNAPGSGLLEIDTYETIKGAVILGDRIALNVTQSNWIVEKTRDAFNPYFVRKVPSVLGTDASFSSVVWNDEVKSIGKTGIISTDGRQSLRIDNKIPYFTNNEIDPIEFEFTYGGFDRIRSQFLWTYLQSASEATSQDKVLAYNYEESSWSINDERFSCFGETIEGQNLAWNDIDEDENPAWATWDQTEEIWNKIGLGAVTQKTLAGDDFGFIYELNQDFDDYFVAIESPGITRAAPAVITTDDQAILVGDRIVIDNVVGMTQINGKTATVTARTNSTLTINIDTSDTGKYDAWISGGSVSKLIDFYAETIPFNPYRDQGKKVWISHIEFLIDTNSGNLRLDILMDGERTPFKSDVLLQPTSVRKDREWVSVSVNNTADFMVLAMRQESVSDQVRVTSIRLHVEPAGSTTD